MIRAQAYIKKQRLIVLGIADLISGPVPFSYSRVIDEEVEDGPVDLGDDLPEPIERAIMAGEKPIHKMIQTEELKRAAEELVVRARQGDQNAMAILGGIRGSAERGSEKAKDAFKAVREYIRHHPPDSDFAGDESREVYQKKIEAIAKKSQSDPVVRAIGIQIFTPSLPTAKAVVMLANGPPITSGFIHEILNPFPNPELEKGILHARSKISNRPDFRAGQIIGRAKRLQEAREPNSSLRCISSQMAWELGE